MKYLTFLMAISTFFACNSARNSGEENTTPPTNQTATPADSTHRFTVSFISIGAGTDAKAKEQFDQFITTFEQKNSLQLKYESTNWGREGEVDYCFNLTTLDQKKQDQFVSETKELLKNSTLVQYSENEPCRQK